MANYVQKIETIGSFYFPFCCDEFNTDVIDSNRNTLLRHDPLNQELRVTSRGVFYNLNKGGSISQIFFSVINLFIKWYYEGWDADSSIPFRLTEAIDKTFIHSIKIVSKEVTRFIEMARLFNQRPEALPVREGPYLVLRDINLQVTSAAKNLVTILFDLIEIQRKLKNKPSELKLYDTPLPVNQAIRAKHRMLQQLLAVNWQISEQEETLLKNFLSRYRKSTLIETIIFTKKVIAGQLQLAGQQR